MYRKFELSLLALFILVIMTSCTDLSLSPAPTPTATLSPENAYAVEMDKILLMIENHKNGAEKNYNLLLAKPIEQTISFPGIDETNSTYGELLNTIFITIDYPIVFEFYISFEENFNVYNTMIDASQDVIESAFDVQVALGGLDVPTSMAVPHREIESCMESITTYHSLLIRILSGSTPTEKDMSNLQENNCDKFDLSLSKIQKYIDEQNVN